MRLANVTNLRVILGSNLLRTRLGVLLLTPVCPFKPKATMRVARDRYLGSLFGWCALASYTRLHSLEAT